MYCHDRLRGDLDGACWFNGSNGYALCYRDPCANFLSSRRWATMGIKNNSWIKDIKKGMRGIQEVIESD